MGEEREERRKEGRKEGVCVGCVCGGCVCVEFRSLEFPVEKGKGAGGGGGGGGGGGRRSGEAKDSWSPLSAPVLTQPMPVDSSLHDQDQVVTNHHHGIDCISIYLYMYIHMCVSV